MTTLNAWDVVDANNNLAPPDGWPENTMNYSEVNNTGRAVQGTMKRFFADINGSLAAGGVADAYTVTLNETGYVAYFAGMYFACEIMATNTGASTIDVNGIGVQTITDRSGNALSPGELQAGGIYEFRYDGTNFQLMGTLQSSPVIPSPIRLLADINTATPPTTEAVTANYEFYDLAGDDLLGALGYNAENELQVRNTMHGGNVALVQEISSGVASRVYSFDGTSGLHLWLDALNSDREMMRLEAGIDSLVYVANVLNDPAAGLGQHGQFRVENQNAQVAALFGFPESGGVDTTMRMQSFVEAGDIRIFGTPTGGGENLVFFGDPDANVGLMFAGFTTLRTAADGIDVTADAGDAVRLELQENSVINAVLEHDDLTSPTDRFILRNEIDSGWLELRGRSSTSGDALMAQFDPDGSARLYWDERETLRTAQFGAEVRTTTDTATIRFFNTSALIGLIGPSTSQFQIDSDLHGAPIVMTGEDAGGVGKELFRADPDGEVSIQHNGTFDGIRFRTAETGFNVRGDGANSARLGFEDTGVATIGQVDISGSAMTIECDVDGNPINLISDSSGSVQRTLIAADPDDDIALFDAGVEVARTLPAASGGFEANNTLTGAGFERVLTTSDLGGGATLVTANKTSITARSSTTTKTADPDLQVALLVNERYKFVGCLNWNETAGNNQGLRFDFRSITGSMLGGYVVIGTTQNLNPATTYMYSNTTLSGNTNVQLGFTTIQRWEIGGQAEILTAGNYGLFWAQVLSDANATNVYGSLTESNLVAIQVT